MASTKVTLSPPFQSLSTSKPALILCKGTPLLEMQEPKDKMRRSVCPYFTPPHIYLWELDSFRRLVWAPQDWTRDSSRSTTWKPRIGDHKVSSADLWGRPTPCGPQWWCAFTWWPSGGPLGQFQVSTGFGCGLDAFVGDGIHVVHACQLLIRRPSLPWIGDISDPWCLAWQPLIG
jgi:hypothetical protein